MRNPLTNHKQIMKHLLLAISLLLAVPAQPVSAEILQTLSGLVTFVNAQTHELHIRFEHPVTGEMLMKTFNVSAKTGFKNVKRLDEIKPNDAVSVDYEESGPKTLSAVYVEVVSLDKVPFTEEQIKKIF